MAFTGFRAPALPLPPNDYNRQQFDELFRALRIYFNLLDSLTPQQAQSYRADNFFGGFFVGGVTDCHYRRRNNTGNRNRNNHSK
jgi:hypothetical protein